MRVVSFIHAGHPAIGLVRDGGGLLLGTAAPAGLKGLIAQDSLAAVAAAPPAGPLLEAGASTYLPVVPGPDWVVCNGLNYDEHRREFNARPREQPPADAVEVEIAGMGTLVNPVIAEPRGGAAAG